MVAVEGLVPINAHPTGDTIPKSPSRNLATSEQPFPGYEILVSGHGYVLPSLAWFHDYVRVCRQPVAQESNPQQHLERSLQPAGDQRWSSLPRQRPAIMDCIVLNLK